MTQHTRTTVHTASSIGVHGSPVSSTARRGADSLSEQADTPAPFITLNDTDKLNQEYALWLSAGISPELLTKPEGASVDLFVRGQHVVKADPSVVAFYRARDVRNWRNCEAFVRLHGSAYEVDESGTSETDGYHCVVTRPSVDGSRSAAACPECSDDAGFFGMGEPDGKTFLHCNSCMERVGVVQRGIPAEYAEVK